MRAETRWTLAAFGVTTAVALTDALLGARLILIGLLIAGPMLAAVRLDGPRTGLVAAYAMGLAVALGPVDGIWGTADQLVLCLVVAVGGGFATAIAFSRTGRERRMAQITRVAEVAQRAILRPIPARLGAMSFATRYLSAAEEALIGGDFYDAAFTPRGLRLIVGDVRGKGLPAVQLASVVLGCFREAAFAEADLGSLVAALNRRVAGELGEEDFVTVVVVEFGPQGWLRLVNCGHPPPLLVQPTGRVLVAPRQPVPPLGLDPAPVVEQVRLGPEDRLLLYTDGLVEARAATGRPFELDERVEACLTAATLDPALDGLVELLCAHAGGRLTMTWPWCWSPQPPVRSAESGLPPWSKRLAADPDPAQSCGRSWGAHGRRRRELMRKPLARRWGSDPVSAAALYANECSMYRWPFTGIHS